MLSLKLAKLDPPTWKRLRELAALAASYSNHVVDALWMSARGYAAPDAPPLVRKERKTIADDEREASALRRLNAARHTRRTQVGDLSGAVYIDCETRAAAAWGRVKGRALNGWQGTPRFSADRALGIAGSGVTVLDQGGRYAVRVRVQSKASGPAFELAIAPHAKRDLYCGRLLAQMASREIKIGRASIVFRPHKGDALIQIAYTTTVSLPAPGQRVATIGYFDPDSGRLLLRSEVDQREFTKEIHTLAAMKTHFDGIRRRLVRRLGRGRGQRQVRRRALLRFGSYGPWASDYIHQWTRRVVDWCRGQGIGRIVVLPLSAPSHPADWPAHEFVAKLSYKAEAAGIEIVTADKASLEDRSVTRGLFAAVKSTQRRAKRIVEAERVLRQVK